MLDVRDITSGLCCDKSISTYIAEIKHVIQIHMRKKLVIHLQRLLKDYANVIGDGPTDLSAGQWKSGIEFLCLLHAHDPSLVQDLFSLDKRNLENCQRAFELAQKKLGVQPLISSEMQSKANAPLAATIEEYVRNIKEATFGNGHLGDERRRRIPMAATAMKPILAVMRKRSRNQTGLRRQARVLPLHWRAPPLDSVELSPSQRWKRAMRRLCKISSKNMKTGCPQPMLCILRKYRWGDEHDQFVNLQREHQDMLDKAAKRYAATQEMLKTYQDNEAA